MKIAYIVNEYPKVSHSFIRREIRALERLGLQIQRIAMRGWSGPLPDEEDARERDRTTYMLKDGPLTLAIPTLAALVATPLLFLRALLLTLRMARRSDRSVARHLIYLAEACRIRPWLRACGAAGIHAHFGTNSTDVAMLAGTLSRLPFSFTVHGPEEFQRPIGLGEKIRRAAFVVAVSSFGRSQLCLYVPYCEWHKIHVVHCGLEPSFYADAAPEGVTARRLVCVGRLVPEKGQILLVEAAARLAAKGLAFELVLAGDGPLRARLEKLIASHGLGGQVRITGWISNDRVRTEILASRALVLASLAEGLPVVIMEAMALRRPVVTTYIAGIPELVRDGETGWLIPAASLSQLIDALEDCLSTSAEKLTRMGQAGHVRAVERHGIDGQAAVLAQLLRTRFDPSRA